MSSKTEEGAFDRLCKLGLASGSTQYKTVTVEAGTSGAAEWEKHRLNNHAEWFKSVTSAWEAKDPELRQCAEAERAAQRRK